MSDRVESASQCIIPASPTILEGVTPPTRKEYLQKLHDIVEQCKRLQKPYTVYLTGLSGHGKSSMIDTFISALDPDCEYVRWCAPVAGSTEKTAKEQTTVGNEQYTLQAKDDTGKMVDIINLVDTRGWTASPERRNEMAKETIKIVSGGHAGPVERLHFM